MVVTPPVATFISFFCETMLHGMYTVLFLTLLHSFWRVTYLRHHSDELMSIKALTVVLYFVTTVHLAIAFRQYLYAFVVNNDANQVFEHVGDATLTLIQLGIEFTNSFFADSILIWRVWVLFNRRYIVIAVPVMLLLGSTSSAYIFLWKASKIKGSTSDFFEIFTPDLQNWSIVSATCTILTNLLSTGLIAGRIWYHNRLMERAMGNPAMTRKYQTILLTFLESGALYSLAWIILMILDLVGSAAIITILDIIAQLTGIVPTVIVLLISRSIDYASYSEQTYSLNSTHLAYIQPPARGLQFPNNSGSVEERGSDPSIALNDIPPPRNKDKMPWRGSYPSSSFGIQTV
ncbi:hypothetical protein VKT23_016887 [Stygiomarasmius scandens]|uniref:Uncharacterized protein n=1 Tax=Marasmiellus scandens TaxID=2682957 RepID=A0ABR1IVY4_9AGAR